MATKFHVWSKTVNLHLGFQILDFPSCPPTFPQCLCIEEFQSKYHRGEQIWAQIWQNQKMELFKLPFSEVLKSPSKSLFCKENVTSSFFWGCHPSPLLSNVRGALALSRFHLHDFFLGFLQLLDFHQKDFCSSRESMDEFPCTSLSLWSCPLQQALKCSFKFAFPRIKQLRCFQGVSIS